LPLLPGMNVDVVVASINGAEGSTEAPLTLMPAFGDNPVPEPPLLNEASGASDEEDGKQPKKASQQLKEQAAARAAGA
jgi:hypothetical protein